MMKKKGKLNSWNRQKMNSLNEKVMNKFIRTLRLKNKTPGVEVTALHQILQKPSSES